ncbi:unnamed protein product, partial [Effrenium voratum]
ERHRRSLAEERPKDKSPQLRCRESAEERGLAAAARLAAAVAAATGSGDPKFRLRRHSAIGCTRTTPGHLAPPVHAWKANGKEDRPERPERPETASGYPQAREAREARDVRETRDARDARAAPRERPQREDLSPPRPRLIRAQSARRPARLEPPSRARSADPRRREAFVPEGTEEVATAEMVRPVHAEHPQKVLAVQAALAPANAGTAASPRLAGARTGHILTAAVKAVSGRRTSGSSIIDQQPTPFRNLSSKIFHGTYGVAKFLGRGASASVWEAVRSDDSGRVAVKVFDQGQRDKRQAHREMKVLSRVRHPRVVEAFEVIETPRLAQLVCEVTYASCSIWTGMLHLLSWLVLEHFQKGCIRFAS